MNSYTKHIDHQISGDVDFRRSFAWSTFGNCCAAFVIGSFALWAPEFALYSEQISGHPNAQESDVSNVFGIITVTAGIVGCGVGAEWARRWRAKNEKSDALVCGIGLLGAAPLMFFALWTANQKMVAMWVSLIDIGYCIIAAYISSNHLSPRYQTRKILGLFTFIGLTFLCSFELFFSSMCLTVYLHCRKCS